MLYLDGNLSASERYDYDFSPPKRCYTANHIGCNVALRKQSGEESEHFTNHFVGEMSALHFVAVDYASLQAVQRCLRKVAAFVDVHSIFPFLAYGEGLYKSSPKMQDTAGIEEGFRYVVVQHSFLVVSPQYAGRSVQAGDAVFIHRLSTPGAKTMEVCSPVDTVYRRTKVHHNYPARDVFINIGGIKCLLPFLYDLAEWSDSAAAATYGMRYLASSSSWTRRDQLVERVLMVLEEQCMGDTETTLIFLERNEGIMVLGYLLGRLAARKGLGAGVYAALKRIFMIFDRHYQDYTEKFTETILYNMDIWKYSPADVQGLVIEQIHNFFIMGNPSPQRVAENIDILLNCIEVYANYDDRANQKPINQLSAIILILAEEFLTNELLFKLVSYANVFYVRRLRNYPGQIYHIMNIFNKICELCNDKILLMMRDGVRLKRESKLLCTVFAAFDYFMNIKEGNDRAGYRGILLTKRHSVFRGLSSSATAEKSEDEFALRMKQAKFVVKPVEACSGEEARAVLINTTPEGAEQIDSIVGSCVYWILTLDYVTLVEGPKEEYRKESGDLVGLIRNRLVSKSSPGRLSMDTDVTEGNRTNAAAVHFCGRGGPGEQSAGSDLLRGSDLGGPGDELLSAQVQREPSHADPEYHKTRRKEGTTPEAPARPGKTAQSLCHPERGGASGLLRRHEHTFGGQAAVRGTSGERQHGGRHLLACKVPGGADIAIRPLYGDAVPHAARARPGRPAPRLLEAGRQPALQTSAYRLHAEALCGEEDKA